MTDISVVIPTFRRQNELTEAVGAVLAQEGVTFEVIVVDDCPDRSAAATVGAIADSRVRYVANPDPSAGRPASVRNFGCHLATGDLVHFLDDDDLVPAGHYAAAKAAFAAHPNVGVVFGRIEPFGASEQALAAERTYFAAAAERARRCRRYGPKWAFAASMAFGPTLLVCSAGMLRRKHVASLGGFDSSLPLVEDVDFYARAIRAFGAHFMDRTALRYRIGPSLMRQPGRDGMIQESYQIMHAAYRRRWGSADFYLLKAFARLVAP
jgi:glycosyltransferase involved in cell wall biosynthesis